MFNGKYHPSTIFKAKRSHKDQDQNREGLKEVKVAVVSGAATGPIVEAKAYLEGVSDLYSEIDAKLQELMVIATNSVKGGTSDAEYKKLNKEFQERKKELDYLTKQKEMKGDAPLSGRYSQKPKIIQLGEGIPAMELKFDPCHCLGLGIDQLRADSLSFGKKARGALDQAKQAISAFRSAIGPKLETLSTRLSAQATESKESTSTYSRGSYDPHVDLKILQERTARAKGRTQGLLVNIKV